jgi:thioredoxin domain-containing protein 5
LYQRYEIPDSSLWAVVVLKDHDSKTPAAIYQGTDSFDTSGDFSPWLLENRLPTSMELTQDTFQSVMNAPHAPLVVIAAVNKENKDKVAERFRDIALKWRVRTSGSGKFAGKSVVFTWMDVERWESWMKSMYGLTKGGKDSIEDVGVVIANHQACFSLYSVVHHTYLYFSQQALKYYDTEQSNVPIKLTSPSIFSALEGAANGTTKAKDSENFVERMARVRSNPLSSCFIWLIVVTVSQREGDRD